MGAGVLLDEQQAVQAVGGLRSAQDLAERFWYLAGVESAGCARAEVSFGAAGADGDAVLVGELLQRSCGAAGFGGDVGQGAVPGQVLLSQSRSMRRASGFWAGCGAGCWAWG